MDEWQPCRFDRAERGYVEWVHFDVEPDDEDRPFTSFTCHHHARTDGAAMVENGWARVDFEDWLIEPDRTKESGPGSAPTLSSRA